MTTRERALNALAGRYATVGSRQRGVVGELDAQIPSTGQSRSELIERAKRAFTLGVRGR